MPQVLQLDSTSTPTCLRVQIVNVSKVTSSVRAASSICVVALHPSVPLLLLLHICTFMTFFRSRFLNRGSNHSCSVRSPRSLEQDHGSAGQVMPCNQFLLFLAELLLVILLAMTGGALGSGVFFFRGSGSPSLSVSPAGPFSFAWGLMAGLRGLPAMRAFYCLGAG